MHNKVLTRVTEACLWISSLFLIAMMIHVSLDVALKYTLNMPVPGTLEIVSAYYMVAGVFLPIAAVELLRSAIVVDVAYMFMPRGMKAFCILLGLVASVLVYGVLTWTSWGDAVRSFKIREVMMGTVLVSVWPSRFVLPVAFLAAAGVCLWHIWAFFTSPEHRSYLIDPPATEEEEI